MSLTSEEQSLRVWGASGTTTLICTLLSSSTQPILLAPPAKRLMLLPSHMENVTEQARSTSIFCHTILESTTNLYWYWSDTIGNILRSTVGEMLEQHKIALLIQADIYRLAYLHMHSMLASQVHVLHYSRFGTYQKIIPPSWEAYWSFGNRTMLLTVKKWNFAKLWG